MTSLPSRRILKFTDTLLLQGASIKNKKMSKKRREEFQFFDKLVSYVIMEEPAGIDKSRSCRFARTRIQSFFVRCNFEARKGDGILSFSNER